MGQLSKIIRFPNGVRLICEPMSGLRSANLGVWVNIGTRNETPHNNGVAHFLEHLVFKGAGQRDAKQLAEDAESRGIYLNAATAYEKTGFFARCLHDEAKFALNICADLVLDPLLLDGDIALEKNVVRHEIKEAFDDAEDRAGVLNQSASFHNQALGMPILGDEKSLEILSSDQIKAFHTNYKNPNNLIIGISGEFDFDEIYECVQMRFGNLAQSSTSETERANSTSMVEFENRDIEQLQLALSFDGASEIVNAQENNIFNNRLYCSILGGGMSSRLFQDLRENRGLVYNIDAFEEKYNDVCRIGIGAGCDANNLGEVVKRIEGHIQDLAQTGPSGGELDRAKKSLETSIMISLENPSARLSSIVGQVSKYGAPLSIDEVSKKIRSASAQDITKIADLAANSNSRAAAAVGPNIDINSLNSFIG